MSNIDACIIGGGYIGLPTAALAARAGLKIKVVDIDSHIVNTINNGDIHIVEPGLADVVKVGIANSNLCATDKIPVGSPLYIICVPTPLITDELTSEKRSDLSYVFKVTESIAHKLVGGEVILLESTSPVGTTKRIKELLSF